MEIPLGSRVILYVSSFLTLMSVEWYFDLRYTTGKASKADKLSTKYTRVSFFIETCPATVLSFSVLH